jgi:outer membrane biosynthesis protein TonB
MPSNRSRLSNSGPATTARDGRFGLIGAVLLHGGVIAASLFSFSHALDIQSQDVPVVPVELVTIADTTSIKAQSPDPPAPEPQEIPPPVEQAAPPPPPEKIEVAPEPKVVEKTPPKVAETPKPAPEKPKQEKFDINNIMARLDKQAPPAKAPNAQTGDRAIRGAGLQDAMTMELGDALRNQIAQCWNPPVGSPNPERLIVTFRMFLAPDGNVAQPPQLTADSANAAARDPFTRAAAEAARRAIYGCVPYKLPANRYSAWRDIEVTFDPRKMMGLN